MTLYLEPMCLKCLHYQDDVKCDAFPSGIPKDLFFKEGDYTKPWFGDHGILFESREKEM